MDMADGRRPYPSVFVVDNGTGFPPQLPPKPGQTRIRNRRKHLIQNTLLVLVCMTLVGLLVEGCLIYTFHKPHKDSEPNSAQQQPEALKAGQNKEKSVTKKPRPPAILQPSKPLAHLTAGPEKPKKDGIMEWNENGESVVHELEYSNGRLIVWKEGYYYVYSQLSYSADGPSFIQTVEKNTKRYLYKSIKLLTYFRHNSNSVLKGTMRNSYLGGVFHLYKGDAVFVSVNNGSLVRLHDSADNYFGMYML